MEEYMSIRTATAIVAVAAFLSFPGSSYAGSAAHVTVTGLVVEPPPGSPQGVAFVYFGGTHSGTYTCQNGGGYPLRFVVDLATVGGRAVYASAMVAYVTGKPVDIVGTGDCAVWADTETILYLSSL
jgi:hypothetical protein